MYNKRLNEDWTERFRRAVEGKRVLLVGNAATLFSEKYGELIDSYDVVLRFGKGYPYAEFKEYLGTRTDVWFFGAGRAGMYKKFLAAPWKVYTPSQMKIYEGKDGLIPKEMLREELQVYEHFFLTGPSDDVVRLNKKVNGKQASTARLSQGIQCIEWLTQKVQSQQEVTLIGFDFFDQSFNYTFDNSNSPNIPKHHPTTSWHCPLVAHTYETNPHMASSDGVQMNEPKYILSLPGVNHIKMPNLDLDKMEEVLKRLRGSGSSIER